MAVVPIQHKVSEELNSDNRDVADLWKDALKAYKGIVGFDLERKFDDVQGMINQGTKEMENFHKFRHNDKKVDKLRSLFAANLDYIEKGAQQLVSAAVPAFPPAAAIGTAVTFMLSACRKVSADYDIVMVFFEDMNSFLQRIVILETRLPKYKAYQNCLMDVFTSFLTMCGFAHKYIELGRFKKWISNLIQGEDSELGGARKKMDLRIRRLQEATEYAILGNTEEIQKMTSELQINQQSHTAMLEEQMQVMNVVRDTTEHIRNDMAKLLRAFEDQQRKDRGSEQRIKTSAAEHKTPPSANGIRNTLPEVIGENHEYQILKETAVADTCSWIFREPEWEKWLNQDAAQHAVLAITGSPGSGKSHIALSIFEKLKQEAEKDASKHTCAAQFYFREQNENLSSFVNGIATVINQVAEQSPPLCELIYAEIVKDNTDINFWSPLDLIQKILGVAFSKTSKNRLLLVFDGIDEIDEDYLPEFAQFLNILNEDELRISCVFTARPEIAIQGSESTPTLSITVTKEKQMEDLRTVIWARMNSLDHLKWFSRYVQQRVADKLEESAPSLLYAEHLLGKLNALGREGAVIRSLERPLPSTLHELYETSIEECIRRTESSYRELVVKLLHWTAFSFRPLTLDEVVSLLRYWVGSSEFDIEDIPAPFAKILQIGGADSDAESRAKMEYRGGWSTAVAELDTSQKSSSSDGIYDDGALSIKFKERSMRGFYLAEPTTPTKTHLQPSEVHRQMFLDCARLIWPKEFDRTEIDENLREYAVSHLITHWRNIDLEKHDVQQRVEAMEALASTFLDLKSFAMVQESKEPIYKEHINEEFFEQLAKWSNILNVVGTQLSTDAAEWWNEVATRPQNCLLHLIQGHIRRLSFATDLRDVWISYLAVRSALTAVHQDTILIDQARKNFESELGDTSDYLDDKQAILGIEGLFKDVQHGSKGYHSLASLLIYFEQVKPAEVTCQKAIDASQTALEKVESLQLMARVHRRTNLQAAYEDILGCLELLEDEDVPTLLRRTVYVTKARIETELGKRDEAAASYAKARSVDPNGLATGDVLEEELQLFEKVPGKKVFMSTLKGWSALERLTWLCWQYDVQSHERVLLPLDVAVETGETAFIIEMYQESIKYLDNVNAAAPMRVDLAYFQIHVRGDLEAARKLLDEVLDSGSTGWPYAVTGESPDKTLSRAINIQSEVLYRLFQDSSDVKYKMELLASLEGLLTRNLPLDVPPISNTSLLYHHIIQARMYFKLGPTIKFQETLESVITASIDALNDEVSWNDWENLMRLATSLQILGGCIRNGNKLERMAQILLSAQFCHLESATGSQEEETKDEGGNDDKDNQGLNKRNEEGGKPINEGDLDDNADQWCFGDCEPRVKFLWWGERTAYRCLVCFDCFLCEDCYHKRKASSNCAERKKATVLCAGDHEYIRGPIKGWKGVVGGKVLIEGEEAVEFSALLQQIEEICKEAWESFWKN
ncbi:NACHT and TPR domain-containing protein [Colletotrichum truncatum]|uniref:NACHT and TPR domain-containing protein n=1 Tax=Colletotrichum truncatum TaxID=5467 RepID=A0ACC3YS53_COLTU